MTAFCLVFFEQIPGPDTKVVQRVKRFEDFANLKQFQETYPNRAAVLRWVIASADEISLPNTL